MPAPGLGEPPNALDQVSGLKGFLDQHGLDACVQSAAVLGVEIERSDHDDWNVPPAGLLLQGRDDLEAIHLGHHQIEQDQVRLALLETIQRFPSVRRFLHNAPLALKPCMHPLPLERVVFNQQHPSRLCRRAKTLNQPMQLLTIDRLGEITSRTECHSAALLIQDGDHDDRDLGEFAILSQCCEYGPSVEIGHYHIESNHTGVYFLGELEPLQSARRSHD